MDIGAAFIPHGQAAEAVEPGQRALHYPTMRPRRWLVSMPLPAMRTLTLLLRLGRNRRAHIGETRHLAMGMHATHRQMLRIGAETLMHARGCVAQASALSSPAGGPATCRFRRPAFDYQQNHGQRTPGQGATR